LYYKGFSGLLSKSTDASDFGKGRELLVGKIGEIKSRLPKNGRKGSLADFLASGGDDNNASLRNIFSVASSLACQKESMPKQYTLNLSG
jgi:hypothetical protein